MASVFRGKSETTANNIASAIRLCRTLAIDNAAFNQHGFSLNMTGTGSYTGFAIINLQTGQTIKSETIPQGVNCSGADDFRFNAIGSRTGAIDNLTVSAGGKTFVISVISSTGMVKCTKQ